MRYFILLIMILLLTACGFHLQGEIPLAKPFKRTYLQISDPYGSLARSLKQYFKMSDTQLIATRDKADIMLVILRDEASQRLLSVSGTQQTRQYALRVEVTFEIEKPNGQTLAGPFTLAEERVMTMQSNQILGNSNEVNLFYQQMRRTLAYAIMNRIASKEVTERITKQMP